MKISVIIPTWERLPYLKHSLATVLAIDDPDLEIVVSDNACSDGTGAFLSGLKDPRLVVANPGRRVSMRENFQCGLDHSSGDYVVFIGDDDGMLPRQFGLLRKLLERERPDSLSWSLPTFGWPELQGGGRAGRARLSRRSCFGTVTPSHTTRWRRMLLAGNMYWPGSYPALYHGAVSRAFLDSLTPVGQPFFRSKVPDFFFTFLAVLTGGRHLHVAHPFSVSGYSKASTGNSHQSHVTGSAAGGPEVVSDTSPANRFEKEAEKDSVQDAGFVGMGVPAAFFITLETVRNVLGPSAPRPAYRGWYQYILRNMSRLTAAERTDMLRLLRGYAVTSGSVTELDRALSPLGGLERRLHRIGPQKMAAMLVKFGDRLSQVKVAALLDGRSDIEVAARIYDTLLADDGLAVASGTCSRRAAWTRVKMRAAAVNSGESL